MIESKAEEIQISTYYFLFSSLIELNKTSKKRDIVTCTNFLFVLKRQTFFISFKENMQSITSLFLFP